MTPPPLERRRYIGSPLSSHGKKHRPAFVPGVGHLYCLEIVTLDHVAGVIRFQRPNVEPVPITAEGLAVLRGGEFESADLYCTYQLPNDQTCDKLRVPGTELCKFHGMLAKAAEAPGDVRRMPVVSEHPDFPATVGDFRDEDEVPLDGPDSLVDDPTPTSRFPE